MIAHLGLGSNVGDRLVNLRSAVDLLCSSDGIRVIACSSVYETEPVGAVDQPWFVNAVAEMITTLTPVALLKHTDPHSQKRCKAHALHSDPKVT